MTDKQRDTIFALHNTRPFRLVRAAAPYFRVKDGAPRCIINISSTSGVNGNAGQVNYGLAKASVTGLTKAIAKETPDGTKVPLGIPKAQKDTSGDYSDIPLRRPGTAIEAARVILAVASPLFSYVDGQTRMVGPLALPFG